MNKVKLSEFDLYGTFRLTKDETAGIKNLVKKIGKNEFLSRNASSMIDFSANTFGKICTKYERLNSLLPMEGKPAFVICERMHGLAVQVVNTIQQNFRIALFQDGEHFDTVAQKCAQECADNLVRLMNGLPAEKTTTNLRDEVYLRSRDIVDLRIIQADNKKRLYMCANALPDHLEHLITPGRGSSKLGTMVQAVRKYKGLKPLGFTQVYYSIYGNHQNPDRVMFSPKALKYLPEKVWVMDDDIDTGRTIYRIKEELTQRGHQVTNGAITTAFGKIGYKSGNHSTYDHQSVLKTSDWSKYIDIIPNLYGYYLDQQILCKALENCCIPKFSDLSYRELNQELVNLLNAPRNGNDQHTADYIAMKHAEQKAHALGADLYQVSEKISPAAVEYNKKIRTQVEQSNAEYQNSTK